MNRLLAALWFGLVAASAAVADDPAANSNGVLEFDGRDSYLEIPSDSFTNCTNATIEGWVKWENVNPDQTFFDLRLAGYRVRAQNHWGSLRLETFHPDRSTLLEVGGVFSTGRWAHVAVAARPDGIALFFNGELLSTNSSSSGPAVATPDLRNYLGQSSSQSGGDLRRQIDEFRVWQGARTQAQVQENMYKHLTGAEPGLAGLWNFDRDESVGRDATGRGHHGTVTGQARRMEVAWPPTLKPAHPELISGRVRDETSHQFVVALQHRGRVTARAFADRQGNYQIAAYAEDGPCDLEARDNYYQESSPARSQKDAWSLSLNPRPGEKRQVDFRLSDRFCIEGTVYALDQSTGLPGVVVQAIAMEDETRIQTSATDAKGRFRFSRIRPGPYRLRCHVDGGTVAHQNAVMVSDKPGATSDKPSPVEVRIAPFKHALWRTYTLSDGFVPSVGMGLHLSPDGSIWVASANGVAHFDGFEFTTLAQEDGLAGSIVTAILEDADGVIWFGTNSGLSRYDPHSPTSKFTNYTTTNGLSHNSVNALLRDPKTGVLWVATARGISLLDGHRWSYLNTTNGLPFNHVQAMLREPTGVFWFSASWPTPMGAPMLARLDEAKKFQTFSLRDGLASKTILAMERTEDGVVWFACGFTWPESGGVSRYDGKRFISFGEKDGWVRGPCTSIARDREGFLWFGGDENGLNRFDGKSFVKFTSDDGLADNSVNALLATPEGHLWVSTSKGLSRSAPSPFTVFDHKDGLPSQIKSVTRFSDGTLWIISAAENSICHFDSGIVLTNYTQLPPVQSGRSVVEDLAGGAWIGGLGLAHAQPDGLHVLTEGNGLPGQTAANATVASDGALWFQSSDTWVARYDGKQFTTNSASVVAPGQIFLSPFAAGRHGTMWLYGVAGLTLADGTQFKTYTTNDGVLLNGPAINPLPPLAALGPDETMWFGSERGVMHFDGTNFQAFTVADGLPDNAVTSLLVETSGLVWVGTENRVSRFDNATRRFHPLVTGKEHVSLAIVTQIYRAEDGIMWFTSGNGVARYDGTVWSALDARDWAPAEGRGKIEGNNVAGVYPGKGGAIWLNTDSGLVRYVRNKTAARIAHVRFDLTREEASLGSILNRSAGLRVRVALQADAIDFNSRRENRFFRFKFLPGRATTADLEKSDNWLAPQHNGEFVWRPGRAGLHTIGVQYIDRDLNYSPVHRSEINIAPPWYLNAWVMAPTGASASGLLAWALVARSLYIRKRREAERLRQQLTEQEGREREALAAKNAQLERAKAEADAANQAKSQFLASMSHELRTPLNAIIGYSEMLTEEAPEIGAQSMVPDLEKIHGAARHQLGLINDILDLSKIEAGKMTLFLEEFDVAQLVSEVKATVQPLVSKNHNQLLVDCPANLGPMRADQTKLRQVLFNLISNSAKFTERGTIQLDVRASTRIEELHTIPTGLPQPAAPALPLSDTVSFVQFRVTDSGIGMTAPQIGKLFQAFSQAEASTAHKYGGTGLGLALSRKFCRLMGGDLTVTSEPSRGSTFTVSLPMTVSEPGATFTAESAPL